jgi:outer membrane protein insertion porin family
LKLLLRCLWVAALLGSSAVVRGETFIVEDIEVEGIKKIAIGTVLNYLPVKNGEIFDSNRSPELIRELYKTGFFDRITLLRRANNLVIRVTERPSIAEVTFDGNKEVNDEIMNDALKQIGMTKGKIYNPKLLEKLEQELQQLYYSLGKYSVRLDATAESLDDDRVKVDIQISEGAPARIRSINVIGNKAFDEEDLLDNFKLEATDSGWFADDKYSSTKLSGDLETLKSWYLDQGYVKFDIESKQVTITPDKKDINIAINIREGEQYRISKISLTGDLIVEESELMALMNFREGDVFSRKRITSSIQRMSERLGNEGYAFAKVNAVPDIDDENKTVALLLVIEPGEKVNVRRILFEGNTKTRDYVLRREMRQMEGEVYSASKINRSKIRLQRLKYIASVYTRLVRVADEPEQLDVLVNVKERFSGNFTIGAGYSQDQGALFNLGLTHDNIFGSGNNVAITFNNNRAQEQYEFSYTNPYYTPEGISRGFSLRYAKTDAAEANISNYLLDRITMSVSYGIPLSEYNQINFNFGLERNDVTLSLFPSNEVVNFIIDNNDALSAGTIPQGDDYDTFFASMSFSTDSRNRLIFPDSGSLNVYGVEYYTGDLDFYKLFYRHQTLFPLAEAVTFSFKTRIGFGESYGQTTDLPFYEKYTAGGVRTVRGYDFNSLGPKDSLQQSFGGNFQVITNTEMLFAIDALGGAESFRLGLYFDAGSVFADYHDFDEKELRTSAGISAKWFTLIGPIELSYAVPLNDKAGDETQNFQFSLGAPF